MAENNLIKKADLARAREIDFVYRFQDGIKKLIEALGITRKIPKQAGTNLKAYKATGTLLDGVVPEGDVIPLSHYKTVPVNFAEITIKKWRKATSAEAIVEKGYDQAVQMTTDEMLKDVQKGIKKNFFSFLATGTGKASGTTFQDTLAQIWGQLQLLYEDTEMQAVYFMNQLDAASYLGSAPITLQTAFGMTYIEDFLGLGTVIFNSSVPKGTIYGTAKENIVLYYVPVNGADLDNAFEFTSDNLGYIGIHEVPDYDNLTAKDTVMCGMVLFAERIDGIVKGLINPSSPVTATVTTDVDTITIVEGNSDTVHAVVNPRGEVVTWASADTTKVTVANGLSNSDVVITGVAETSAAVNVTASIGGSVVKTITVNVEAASL